ncbi:MAG TPA: hypothetical protein VLX58_07790 [Bryobacteraceae bacterium]|nr:hypothetical protein [Bryobacteraceae bacterium]
MLNWIGWLATAVFSTSYFCRRPRMLKAVQAAAALLWLWYGVLMHALPVIVANSIVAVLAIGSAWAPEAQGRSDS